MPPQTATVTEDRFDVADTSSDLLGWEARSRRATPRGQRSLIRLGGEPGLHASQRKGR